MVSTSFQARSSGENHRGLPVPRTVVMYNGFVGAGGFFFSCFFFFFFFFKKGKENKRWFWTRNHSRSHGHIRFCLPLRKEQKLQKVTDAFLSCGNWRRSRLGP